VRVRKPHVNAQREISLLAQWLSSLNPIYQQKTHVKVGADPLLYAGIRLTPAQSRAFGVWSNWADARVVTPSEVWICEAKLVATGAAYGQLIDYLDEYPSGDDYRQFKPRQIVGIVVCQAVTGRTERLFRKMGIRTIIFQPSFDLAQSLGKIFPGSQILETPQSA